MVDVIPRHGRYALAVGVEPKLLGVMFCLFNLVTAVGSHYAAGVQKRLGELTVALLCVGGIALSYAVMGLGFSLVGLGFIAIQQFVRGLYTPIFDALVQAEIGSARRATLSSVQSLFCRLGGGVFYLVSSTGMGGREIPDLLLFGSGFVLIAGLATVVVLYFNQGEPVTEK